LAAWVLMHLDGSRDRDALLADMMTASRVDPSLAEALAVLSDGGGRDRIARASLDRLLGVFARAGLLAPDQAAETAGGGRDDAGV
jgi:hypothetical protein